MFDTEYRPLKIAVLDLNAGHPNQGMRCIREVVHRWAAEKNVDILYDVFDVRVKNEIPDLSYDIYISSGGPGDPLSTRFDDWDIQWNRWLGDVVRWNNNPDNTIKKICISDLSFLPAGSSLFQCRVDLQKKIHFIWDLSCAYPSGGSRRSRFPQFEESFLCSR